VERVKIGSLPSDGAPIINALSWAPVFTPLILAPWEAEIRRVVVMVTPRKILHEIPISTNGWTWWGTPVTPNYAED
jgi:hypothetical protein